MAPDNWWGPKSEGAYQEFLKSKEAPIGEMIEAPDPTWTSAKASTFADPEDVRRFKKCKLQGGYWSNGVWHPGSSDLHCFEYGDNGIGFWEDDTTVDEAYFALHKDIIRDHFGGDLDKGHGAKVRLVHKGKEIEGKVMDICGVRSRIDLNPGACKALGIPVNDLYDVTWRWA